MVTSDTKLSRVLVGRRYMGEEGSVSHEMIRLIHFPAHPHPKPSYHSEDVPPDIYQSLLIQLLNPFMPVAPKEDSEF